MQPPINRRVKITINGNTYLVEVDDMDTSPITVTVNGQPYHVSFAFDDMEITSTESTEPTQSPSHEADVPKKVSASAGPAVTNVSAPMPGNILNILVKPGDRVTVKQQLCSLEAMKMKNAIRAPRDGVIATVHVSEGQAVAHGDVLFSFE